MRTAARHVAAVRVPPGGAALAQGAAAVPAAGAVPGCYL